MSWKNYDNSELAGTSFWLEPAGEPTPEERAIAIAADALHEDWRANYRAANGDKPRWKKMNPESLAWLASRSDIPPTALQTNDEGATEIDIAALTNSQLPPQFSGENTAAATGVVNALIGNLKSDMEQLASVVHDQWLARNGSWAPESQKVPYAELPEEEKEKDRVVVRAGRAALVSVYCHDGMATERRLKNEIADRARAANVGDQPDSAVHRLGNVLGDVPVHLRHAVDAVVLDRKGNVLLIERAHNPGKGKLALPGGFIDPAKGGTTENVADATLRELAEETGLNLPEQTTTVVLGPRQSHRPFDVRQAFRDMPDVSINKGDLFTVSTQARAFVVDDLTKLNLLAGDDARRFVVRRAEDLRSDELGIADHHEFISRAISQTAAPKPARKRILPFDLFPK